MDIQTIGPIAQPKYEIVVPKRMELSKPGREALAYCRSQHWQPYVIGCGPMLTESIRLNGLEIGPIEEDSTPIPLVALPRIEKFTQNFPTQGMLIAHELPKGKAVPSVNWSELLTEQIIPAGVHAAEVYTRATVNTVVFLAKAFLVVAMALGDGLDPMIVMVLPDGTYVSIFSWIE